MNPYELHQTFSASEYGLLLEGNVRAGRFKPGWLSNAGWVELMGDNANNLHHMPYMHDVTLEFCHLTDADRFSKRILTVTAMTHDWGEAIVGDIPAPFKTNDDTQIEHEAFKLIANKLLGEEEGDHITTTVWTVLLHQNPRLGDVFRAIEHFGYTMEGIRAHRLAHYITHDLIELPYSEPRRADLSRCLAEMAIDFQSNSMPVFAAYSKRYPELQTMLRARL